MQPSALIDFVDVHKIYNPGRNEVRALNGVTLQIHPGELVAIMGSSGSGKTTLMNLLGCLDLPSQGEYCLSGKAVAGLTDDALSAIRNQKIGFVFQRFHLIPSLNALENVELPLRYRGIPKGKRRLLALEALDRMGLSDRLAHQPGELSGGQQQRVAIARAIAAKPPLILADEPTGNLDSRAGEEVIAILRELWRNGKTVILITHDPDIAAQTNRLIRLHDGRIAKDRVVPVSRHCTA